jgi:hypothetical protein
MDYTSSDAGHYKPLDKYPAAVEIGTGKQSWENPHNGLYADHRPGVKQEAIVELLSRQS